MPLDVADDKIDRGTVETRRRLTPDSLMSGSLDAHRISAGMCIRTALEEGVGCKALDMVRIGMAARASSGITQPTPLDRLLIEREWLSRWRAACRRQNLQHCFAEEFALGHSIRQIVGCHVLLRHKVGQLVHDGLDLYAELRGFLPKPSSARTSIRVAESQDLVAPQAGDDQPLCSVEDAAEGAAPEPEPHELTRQGDAHEEPGCHQELHDRQGHRAGHRE